LCVHRWARFKPAGYEGGRDAGISAALGGESTLDGALFRTRIAIAQYAERRAIWFRRRLDERWRRI
jgi:tRNA A37 N6-isopentenylltransferase MiaA